MARLSEIYAELADPERAAESARRYEAEMLRRFGPRSAWPKLDSAFSAQERAELEQKRAALCEHRARRDEKRRRRMARIEAMKPFQYPEPNFDPDKARMRLAGPAYPEPPFIVGGYLPFRTVAGFTGEGGTAKTTYLQWESMHIALGLPLFGQQIERPGPVLFLTGEDDFALFQFRAQRIAEGLSLTPKQIEELEKRLFVEDVTGKMLRLVESDESGNLRPTGVGDELIERYRDRGIVLLIVDPTNLFGPGERHVNDAEAALMVEGQRIARALGCTVRYVHHVAKAIARDGTVDQYVGRGGAAFADNSRAQHHLVRHSDAANGTTTGKPRPEYPLPILLDSVQQHWLQTAAEQGRVLRLHTTKLSWAPRSLAPIWIVREGFKFTVINQALQVSPKQQSAANARAKQSGVIGYVARQLKAGVRLTERQLTDQNFRAMGLSRPEARRIVNELIQRGHLKHEPLPETERRGSRQTFIAPGDKDLPVVYRTSEQQESTDEIGSNLDV